MNRRLIAAFLIVPWITSAVFAIALSPYASSFNSVVIIYLLYAAFAYIAEAILGLPAFLIYRFFRCQGFVAHGLGGILLGFLAVLFVAIVYSPFTRATSGEFILCLGAGAVAGLAFRFIAGKDFQNRRRAVSDEI
jgi:hypothetical protein